MNWSQEKYIEAYRFAAEAHFDQKFPGTDLPYLLHVGLVTMEIIASLPFIDIRNGDLAIQCALLHDVIEDTEISFNDVKLEFGNPVANGVLALTKNIEIEKELQMKDSVLRIREQPDEVWMVKLADRITNLATPPKDWGQEKIIKYRDEAIIINKSLGSANDYLQNRLSEKINEYGVYIN
jgi:guanosine-3',5'-bis(diphosphate) 3'-pyrophosphohydrolase